MTGPAVQAANRRCSVAIVCSPPFSLADRSWMREFLGAFAERAGGGPVLSLVAAHGHPAADLARAYREPTLGERNAESLVALLRDPGVESIIGLGLATAWVIGAAHRRGIHTVRVALSSDDLLSPREKTAFVRMTGDVPSILAGLEGGGGGPAARLTADALGI